MRHRIVMVFFQMNGYEHQHAVLEPDWIDRFEKAVHSCSVANKYADECVWIFLRPRATEFLAKGVPLGPPGEQYFVLLSDLYKADAELAAIVDRKCSPRTGRRP